MQDLYSSAWEARRSSSMHTAIKSLRCGFIVMPRRPCWCGGDDLSGCILQLALPARRPVSMAPRSPWRMLSTPSLDNTGARHVC
jgi:hypothetical protein